LDFPTSSVKAQAWLNIGWQALAACFIALVCVSRAASHLRRTAALRAAEPGDLLRELLAELGAVAADTEAIRQAAVADLNQRLSDVSFELGLLPARFSALTRVSSSTGMALGLFGYIGATERTLAARVIGFAVCSLSGVLGAGTVLALGRTAKRRAARIRQEWDRSSREVGRALGASPASARGRVDR
jgi:hypothetical protein